MTDYETQYVVRLGDFYLEELRPRCERVSSRRLPWTLGLLPERALRLDIDAAISVFREMHEEGLLSMRLEVAP